MYMHDHMGFWKKIRSLKAWWQGARCHGSTKKNERKGYYHGNLDGIYGDGMKKYVVKFKEDNNLKKCHDINKKFYEKIGITLVD